VAFLGQILTRLSNPWRSPGTRRAIIRSPIWPFLISRSRVCRRFAHVGSRFRFRFERLIHSGRAWGRDSRASGAILRQIGQVVFLPGIFAATVTAILLWLPTAHIVQSWAPTWVVTAPSKDSYLAVLTTVAAAAGAFLALYFTSMSVVASTAYSRVPNEIRQLVLRDKVSGVYLKLIAHSGTVAAFGLAAIAGGFGGSTVLMLYTALLLGIMVFAFVRLGCHIFAFFDPDILAHGPLGDFLAAIDQATPASPRWLQPSFQDHARRQAERAMQQISALVDYAAQQSARPNGVILGVLQRLVTAVRYYSSRKSQIPSDSYWFPRRPYFERWPLQDSTATDIALRTGTIPELLSNVVYEPLLGRRVV